jgi:hypothetical protein
MAQSKQGGEADCSTRGIISTFSGQVVGIHRTGHENQSEGLPHEDSNDSDSDYLPSDEASSREDEEAIEIFTKFK